MQEGRKEETGELRLEPKISVHEMLSEEERAVRKLFKKNLGYIDRFFFGLAFRDALKSTLKQQGGCLVAMYEGRVVGSVSLRILSCAGKRFGLIDAIVSDRGFRGRGVGKSLLEAALSWFEERECEVIYAIADRYNSPSWNMFIHKGFSIYEFREQLRDLGLNFIRLWFSEFYIVGFGTFFLKKASGDERPSEAGEAWHFLAAWLGLALLWWILAIRASESPVIIPLFFGIGGISLFAHELAHKLAASRFGLKTTFKVWDSGLLFSSLLAVVFGAFFPAYGSTYIKQADWRYDFGPRKMGLIYAAGPTISLALAISFWALLSFASNELLVAAARVGYETNLIFVILNLIPIQAAGGPAAWDGRKIFAWNKIIWALLTMGIALLILTDSLF